eukprot:scaffold8203_cov271-Chaetoceros_neogracile.AAC.2
MNLKYSALIAALAVSTTSAFTGPTAFHRSTALSGIADDDIESAVNRASLYEAGAADTPFAKRYRDLKGKKVKTLGEAFADFTDRLGTPINALYKNMMTDIVGTTHLTVVNARFVRDPIWSLGMVSSLELLLKNYPETEARQRITTALFDACGLNEEDVRSEATALKTWAAGKTSDQIATALKGEGDGPIVPVALAAKADEFWMYSRFFSIGLVSMMEDCGVDPNADDVYPVMEEWMGKSLGKSHFTACSDSDTYFKIKNKLDMMETMMKEIEIREKKRMAERLEDKAEAALKKAERGVELEKEIAKEAEEKAASS